jgi:hypothetical protein
MTKNELKEIRKMEDEKWNAKGVIGINRGASGKIRSVDLLPGHFFTSWIAYSEMDDERTAHDEQEKEMKYVEVIAPVRVRLEVQRDITEAGIQYIVYHALSIGFMDDDEIKDFTDYDALMIEGYINEYDPDNIKVLDDKDFDEKEVIASVIG